MDYFINYISSIFSKLGDFETFLYAVYFAGSVALIVGLVELIVDAKTSSIAQILKNKKSATIDILFWFFHYSPLFVLVLALSTAGVLNIIKVFLHAAAEPIPHMADGILLFLILFVAYDFIGYLTHRLMHKFVITWKFHELHHSARSFNIFTVHRVHPVDSAVIKFAQTFVALALGASAFDIFWFTTITLVLGTVKHSNLVYGYPWIFKYLIQSPGQHWIHHSEEPKHFNKNFGEILQIWDVIFGTSYNLSKEELKNITIGTEDTITSHESFLKLIMYPYYQTFDLLKRKMGSPK